MTTICLNMIVKDEAHVIERCLASVKPMIDYYVIVDTGSTDNTKALIAAMLEGIPGEIHDRPWKDFGYNRTEAIQLAAGKADYLLVIDADDEMKGPRPTHLIHDCYSVMVHEASGLAYERAHIFKANNTFRYVGVLHEYLDCTAKPFKGSFLPGLKYIRHIDGARWGTGDKEAVRTKFTKDAHILKAALEKEPDNTRYAFYLAQSWRDAGEYQEAIMAYSARIAMSDGDAQEQWYCRLQVATLKQQMPHLFDQADVIDAYLKAYESRPSRIEAMYELGKFLQQPKVNRHQLCYYLLKPLIDAPIPDDRLFVDVPAYTWGLKDVFAVSALQVGDTHAARQINEELLMSGLLSHADMERVALNYAMSANSPEQSFSPIRLEKNHLPMDNFFGDFLGRLREAISVGGSEFGLGLTLFSLAISIRAESVVEIGRFKGFSTFALAAAMKFLTEHSWEETPSAKQRPGFNYEHFERVGGVRKVYSVDPYPTPEANAIIVDNDLKKYVTFFDRRSSQMTMRDFLKRPDIVFIDGDHSFEGCLEDVKRFVPMLKPGGYFILHDYFGWYDEQNNNGSPIKKVTDQIISQVPSIERVLIDTGYMSFIIFRKTEGASQ